MNDSLGRNNVDCDTERKMKLRAILVVITLFISQETLANCNVHTAVDWMDKAVLPVLPVRPADCAVAAQTPPDFNWPHAGRGVRYSLHVVEPAGKVRTATTAGNWYSWSETFVPGAYSWWVVARSAAGRETRSATRTFVVPDTAIPFVMEPVDRLLDQALSQGRPRGLPRGEMREALLRFLNGERREAFGKLLDRVDRYGSEPPPVEPTLDTTRIAARSEQVKVIQALWQMMNVEETRVLESAFAAAMTRRPARVDIAVRRMMNLTAWDPQGATSYASQFQVSRAIVRTLAVGYDWLYEFLTPAQRAVILSAINARMPALVDSVVGDARNMEHNALNSVGLTNLGVVASVSSLMVGELPVAADWFRQAVPLYANLLWPWGGGDGGYANGMNYAMWEIADAWLVWDTLKNAIGLNLADKAYARNFARTLMYFTPPGAAQGVFGDGAEQRMPHVYARYIKAYAQRVPVEEMRWLSALTVGEDASDLALLMGSSLQAVPVDRRFPDDYLNLSTGWVAMHSDLKARDRVSIYFKSSPYGSLSHGHADQNAIVINAAGRHLLVGSGYYDWYGSPHGKGWYKQTIAHNAVTFDGGRGQAIMDQGAQGAIRRFSAQTDYAFAQGDATRAYGGQLKRAVRTVVYLRPERVVIYDELESATPRLWELNFHALEAMQWNSGQLVISNGNVRACTSVWSPANFAFTQRSGFDDPPAMANHEQQWHAVLRSASPATSATWVTVIDIGCHASSGMPAISRTGDRVRIGLEGVEVIFDGGADPVVTRNSGAHNP
ncbi:MAG: heparinase II/III family protein [Hydrogenophilales bacterium]|nr:heparinase II/III family protein [Hydrogenophilales bacterium]